MTISVKHHALPEESSHNKTFEFRADVKKSCNSARLHIAAVYGGIWMEAALSIESRLSIADRSRLDVGL